MKSIRILFFLFLFQGLYLIYADDIDLCEKLITAMNSYDVGKCISIINEMENVNQINVKGNGELPIISAVKINKYELVELLIKKNAEVNAEDVYTHGTALMRASRYGFIKIMKLLIDNKADVNKKDMFGITALHYAVEKGSEDAVILLLENNADPAAVAQQGRTPLSMAKVNEFSAIIKLLENAIEKKKQ